MSEDKNTNKDKNNKKKQENTDPKEVPLELTPESAQPANHVEESNDQLHLSGMYQEWFLDYASYVILERAVPHINDGLKPVQRRILHSMKRMDDGRYNKVANIIGHTMQFHPHGDASIGDALVQLGQKELLIDAQGNWGNILTGDGAAAPRYIEARLSKFALEVTFSPKVTIWKPSYDGRNKEPLTLPVKFPLLLMQGVEGIAVGLASKIMPHNFNELIDASIAHLNNESFELFPDFQTGGYIDVSRYNDGLRGGNVKVRAKISKLDNKTLIINDIPYGKTTESLIDSIIKANDKGKIKIKKVDDNTAQNVEIIIYLAPGTSSDKTIDALYAFTDCEISISPNCCVIRENTPVFIGVSEILKTNTENTVNVLRDELLVRKRELEESWHLLSLEKIFIEERIYKDKGYENAKDKATAIVHIDKKLEPFKPLLKRDITHDDIMRLFEIKMGRILKYNADKAQDRLDAIEEELKEVEHNITHIIPYTIKWYTYLKEKYGKDFPRNTEIRSFETIEAAKVVVANEKLYINRQEGFIGTSLKKDEYICNCSDIDDVIIIYKDGRYQVTKVAEKKFVGKNILHIDIFKKNDKRTIYNVIYRDGRGGNYYMKRFAIPSLTRDKEYDLTQETKGSRILYFTANANGEAEVVKVTLKPKPRLRNLIFESDFGEMAIKGRGSKGNLLTKNDIHKISLKQKGVSTLGGRKIYFDKDVLRLNSDGRGTLLGEFSGEESILVLTNTGEFYNSTFELSNHYEPDLEIIEKFEPHKVWSAAFYDADQKYFYLKRFTIEPSQKRQSLIGENSESHLVVLTDEKFPQITVSFKGDDKEREPLTIDVEEFISIKSHKARGKRITTFDIGKIEEIEPLEKEVEEPEQPDVSDNEDEEDDEGQMKLF